MREGMGSRKSNEVASGEQSTQAASPRVAYGPSPGVLSWLRSKLSGKDTKAESETQTNTQVQTQQPQTTTAPTTQTSGGSSSTTPEAHAPEQKPQPLPPEQIPTLQTATFEEVLSYAVSHSDLGSLTTLATDKVARDKVREALMTGNQAGTLLSLIAQQGAATWAPELDDASLTAMMTKLGYASSEQYNLLWTLYGDPTTRGVEVAKAAWQSFYTSRVIPQGSDEVWWPGGQTADGAGGTVTWRTFYLPLAPTDATWQQLLVGLRPLPRGHVDTGHIAFVHESQLRYSKDGKSNWTNHGNASPIGTSYYLSVCKTSVITVDATGSSAPTNHGMIAQKGENTTGVGGVEGGPSLTWFLNHARHEVGHAVGAFALEGMSEKGDDWALAYGGWKASSASDFQTHMWSESGDRNVTFGTDVIPVKGSEVSSYVASLMATTNEPSGNSITAVAMSIDDKLKALQAAFSDQEGMRYFMSIYLRTGLPGFQGSGYEFRGYTPSRDPIIWCSRWQQGFVTYSKAAYDALNSKMGWYCLSSPMEMFAELYTHHYSGGVTPAAVNGKDPQDLFDKLNASKDAKFTNPDTAAKGSLPMHPPQPSAPPSLGAGS